jgi:tetratricopeptide (TPR) repeat protein
MKRASVTLAFHRKDHHYSQYFQDTWLLTWWLSLICPLFTSQELCAQTSQVATTLESIKNGPPSPKQQQVISKITHPFQEEVEACRDCHPDEVEGFKNTHMSNAMSQPLLSKVIENFSPKKSTVIHQKTGIGYRAYIDDTGRWWQEEFDPKRDYRRSVEVKYLIGSGNHTRSYIGEVHGELIELPLTWYSATDKRSGLWDMSPGYQRKNHFRFERPIKGDCLFCHNDLGKINRNKLAGFVGQLPSGITCRRCHGDGQAHIETRLNGLETLKGEADPTIYNSKHESIDRQHQLCEQCHLSGEARALLPKQSWDTYDPRMPLDEYLRIYAFPIKQDQANPQGVTQAFGIASHVERMKLSECAKHSSTFTCTTCHNPHQPDGSSTYQNACLSCHSNEKRDHNEQILTCETSHQEGNQNKFCFECHMNQSGTNDIPHVKMTDHWIRRTLVSSNELKEATYESELESLLPPLKPKLKSYEDGLIGLAYADLVRFNRRSDLTGKALQLLVKAAQSNPHWPEVWSSLAELSDLLGDNIAAMAAYQKYSELAPDDEYYRLKESTLLALNDNHQKTEQILNHLIKLNPSSYRPFEQLANLRLKQKRYDEADALYAKASMVAPDAHSPVHNRGFLALMRGDLNNAKLLFHEGIRRDGVSREGPFYLALLYAAEKKYELAVQAMTEALRRDETYSLAYQQLTRILYEQKKVEEALSTLRLWIKQEPSSVDARFWLAQYLDAEARYDEAYTVLYQAKQDLYDPRLSKALKIASERLKLQNQTP